MNCFIQYTNGKEIESHKTKNTRRMAYYINELKEGGTTYIKVSDDFGYNDGTYTNKQQLIQAWKAWLKG